MFAVGGLSLQDPAGNRLRPQIVNQGGGIHTVTYTPESVGR